jgi:anti-sigma regulatory factor (Ser/Thr protein kinase)
LLVKRAADSRTEWYPTQGIPIGAVRGDALSRTLRDERIVLQPGDVLVQYTDGINEAFDPQETQFGFERIEKAVDASCTAGGTAVIDGVRRDLEAWRGTQPPHDDETLLVVTYEGAAVTAGSGASDVRSSRTAGASRATSSVTAAPHDPDPLQVLARARTVGRHLSIPADLDQLVALRAFVEGCPGFEKASPADRTIAETALYEVCANVIEHGYGEAGGAPMDLWWIPCQDTDPLSGRFVVVDSGHPFAPEPGHRLDFHDSDVRRRGRGLGLEIIREAMRHVSYHPGTAAGNVTILAFDPSRSRMEEVSHE